MWKIDICRKIDRANWNCFLTGKMNAKLVGTDDNSHNNPLIYNRNNNNNSNKQHNHNYDNNNNNWKWFMKKKNGEAESLQWLISKWITRIDEFSSNCDIKSTAKNKDNVKRNARKLRAKWIKGYHHAIKDSKVNGFNTNYLLCAIY